MEVHVGGVALDGHGAVSAYRYQEQQQRHIGTAAHLATGGFAGVVSKTCIAPLAPHHPLPDILCLGHDLTTKEFPFKCVLTSGGRSAFRCCTRLHRLFEKKGLGHF